LPDDVDEIISVYDVKFTRLPDQLICHSAGPQLTRRSRNVDDYHTNCFSLSLNSVVLAVGL